jgi:hypothetical protein
MTKVDQDTYHLQGLGLIDAGDIARRARDKNGKVWVPGII